MACRCFPRGMRRMLRPPRFKPARRSRIDGRDDAGDRRPGSDAANPEASRACVPAHRGAHGESAARRPRALPGGRLLRLRHQACRPGDPGGAALEMDMAVEMAKSDPDRIVPSVLLVDDRPENLLALEGVLKPLGARLVKARSGEDALLHLLRETFAVILLDVQMPRLDGLQTAELIKQREQTRHIPIIFITALSRETAYIFKGYEQGAVDYLLKPIDPEILRAASRLEAGSVELQTSQFDLSALLEEMRNRMQPLGDRHPIRINAPEKLSLIADKDRIEQVLANLLSNAIRYSPEGGPIEVDAETTGDGVHIRVRDRGLGIPREHQQLVFERFGRAHGSAFGGLGLGLAISKGIVERHGGRIWVESTGRPGEGSVFHVQLPLVTPPAQT